jgi:hypothetical protein
LQARASVRLNEEERPMIDARPAPLQLTPFDDPDWDGARTRRLALKVPRAEFCQSSLSYQAKDAFTYHRSDFAYEGLLAILGGENWKLLDRIGFQLLADGTPVAFENAEIAALPDRVVYHYTSVLGKLSVAYRLLDTDPFLLVASYRWTGASDAVSKLELLLKPIVDIRHMYYFSDPEGHRVGTRDPRMLTVGCNRWLAFSADRDFVFHDDRHVWDLLYRMGSGDRELSGQDVVFKREMFRGSQLGVLRFELGASPEDVTLFVSAGLSDDEAKASLSAAVSARETLEHDQDLRWDAVATRFVGLSPEVLARIYVMAEKFGMPAGDTTLPEQGGWWFRRPWFPPLFEGFMHNHRTLARLGKHAVMEETIRQALRFQDAQTARLPVRFPDTQADLDRFAKTGSLPPDYYHSSDVGLHLFSWLAEIVNELRDPQLLDDLYAAFLKLYASFRLDDPRPRQGNPLLAENGLLMSVPSHSWMNGKRRIKVEGIAVGDLPQRVDRSWQEDAVRQFLDGHTAWDRYQYPAMYLPEINARWIRMLEVGQLLALRQHDDATYEELIGVLKLATGNYKKVFWNSGVGFLYNLIAQNGRPDPMPTAPGLEAIALLGKRVFSRQDMEQAWQVVRDSLLVTRQLGERQVPFGILAKDSQERIFFGDGQYHEAVCWPRETPYLVTLLSHLGEREAIADVLASNLAHQMDEGVVFYHQEMLSLPLGGNAHAGPRAQDPVPVKNPMQWVSQFCDVYLSE